MADDLNTYELTYIISAVLKDNKISRLVNRFNELIEDHDGEILEVDEWGTQRLAYSIDRKRSGHYVNMYFKAPGPLIGRLERALSLEDNILRFLTLRMDATMLRHYEERGRQKVEVEDEEG